MWFNKTGLINSYKKIIFTISLTINIPQTISIPNVQVLVSVEETEIDSTFAGRCRSIVVPLGFRLDPIVGGEAGHQQTNDQAISEECRKDKAARPNAHIVLCSIFCAFLNNVNYEQEVYFNYY